LWAEVAALVKNTKQGRDLESASAIQLAAARREQAGLHERRQGRAAFS
jgi:hypothetical protein